MIIHKTITSALVLFSLLLPISCSFAQAPVAKESESKTPEVIEVTLPDGTKQKGFVLNGQFVRMDQASDPQVPATPETAVTQESKLLINTYLMELSNPKLEKTLNRQYDAYRVVIENRSKEVLEVINGDITNGINGHEAYESSKRNTTGRALGWWFFTGGIGGGISAIRNSSRNKASKANSMGFDNRFPSGPLPPGAQSEIQTFVPIGNTPRVNIVFKDAKGEIKYANR